MSEQDMMSKEEISPLEASSIYSEYFFDYPVYGERNGFSSPEKEAPVQEHHPKHHRTDAELSAATLREKQKAALLSMITVRQLKDLIDEHEGRDKKPTNFQNFKLRKRKLHKAKDIEIVPRKEEKNTDAAKATSRSSQKNNLRLSLPPGEAHRNASASHLFSTWRNAEELLRAWSSARRRPRVSSQQQPVWPLAARDKAPTGSLFNPLEHTVLLPRVFTSACRYSRRRHNEFLGSSWQAPENLSPTESSTAYSLHCSYQHPPLQDITASREVPSSLLLSPLKPTEELSSPPTSDFCDTQRSSDQLPLQFFAAHSGTPTGHPLFSLLNKRELLRSPISPSTSQGSSRLLSL